MSKLLARRWHIEGATGRPHRDRLSGEYHAYLPDKLLDRRFRLDGDVAAEIAAAEAAIVRLNAEGTALTNTEALARILLRAESVASSRIEGLQIGPRRLLRAEVARQEGLRIEEVRASEVLANIDAMAWAIESAADTNEIALGHLLETHRRLLAGSHLEAYGGIIRSKQNWIGGSDYNPLSASFVPPPPEKVLELLEDLASFCNTDSLPAVAQAGIAHAQFETIHPFVDGNGRTGRVLIHLILKKRGLAPKILPPVSLVLATWSRDYVAGLTATRYVGDPDSREAHGGLNSWLSLFASACSRAVEDASSFERRVEALQKEWRQRLGSVRKNSAVDLLLQALPGAPVLTAKGAAALVGRSFVQANQGIARLVDAGVLTPVSLAQRNRAFEAKEVVDAFADLERQLASPGGDTLTSEPSRLVPPRRR